MRKLIITMVIFIHGLIFTQFRIDPDLFVDPHGEFSIKLPKGFKRLVGNDYRKFFESRKFLFNKRLDSFLRIYVFTDTERYLVIKVYGPTYQLKEDKLRIVMENFSITFNERMSKYRKPYRLYYENYEVKKLNARKKIFLFYGTGNHYVKNSAFIQGVINFSKTRTFILHGFVKQQNKQSLDKVYLKSFLSFKPKKKLIQAAKPSNNPIHKKWFRYLILFVIAIALTVLYNRYTKQKRMKALAPQRDDNDDS